MRCEIENMDYEWIILILVLALVAYVMYFFFLRRVKRNKIDPFVISSNKTKSEGEEGESDSSDGVWTHSQRVANEEADLKCIVESVGIVRTRSEREIPGRSGCRSLVPKLRFSIGFGDTSQFSV